MDTLNIKKKRPQKNYKHEAAGLNVCGVGEVG